eukprot:164036-Rhodomonas_salina.2
MNIGNVYSILGASGVSASVCGQAVAVASGPQGGEREVPRVQHPPLRAPLPSQVQDLLRAPSVGRVRISTVWLRALQV